MGKNTEAAQEFRKVIELTEDPQTRREAEQAAKRLE